MNPKIVATEQSQKSALVKPLSPSSPRGFLDTLYFEKIKLPGSTNFKFSRYSIVINALLKLFRAYCVANANTLTYYMFNDRPSLYYFPPSFYGAFYDPHCKNFIALWTFTFLTCE